MNAGALPCSPTGKRGVAWGVAGIGDKCLEATALWESGFISCVAVPVLPVCGPPGLLVFKTGKGLGGMAGVRCVSAVDTSAVVLARFAARLRSLRFCFLPAFLLPGSEAAAVLHASFFSWYAAARLGPVAGPAGTVPHLLDCTIGNGLGGSMWDKNCLASGNICSLL